VRGDIDRILALNARVASRGLLFRCGLTRQQVDNEVRHGSLVAIYPRSYVRPWDADDPAVRERAAVLSVGAPAELSHLSGLRRRELLPHYDGPVHVAVCASRMPRGGDGLTIHRMKSLPKSVLVDGVPTFPVAEALVSSWPLLSGPDRRAPAITAARDRLVTPAQLKTALQAASRLAGRAELVELVRLLDEGCESELEIWGYLDVFSIPGLRHASRRKWVDARGRRYRLDLAYEVERVAIELDGARYHTGKARWELDRRRDAALSSIGWLTLRFSHDRLHSEVRQCQQEALATLAARR
jgi:very-short-patch-repair endonuclease